MHILLTVNASWNVWNFRKSVVVALIERGHTVTVLAPHDEYVVELEKLGCRCVPLKMNAKGLNPLDELTLFLRFRRIFAGVRPDVILSYTIKNNIFGALAAKSLGIPFVPNVSGLGTGFLSGPVLQFAVEQLYRLSFAKLAIVFFQNKDDRDLFTSRGLVQQAQARLLPGSGIDLERFSERPLTDKNVPIFLLIARLLRDKGILEYVDAARQIKATHPQAQFQILGATGSENRTSISDETVSGWVTRA